ncbi:hypothetical protein HanHA300_Chr12g0440471 [Helianthus annuus]|nr:hypothetical protein HanHA300_Chr12g0440471 [Helianthus annuus]KAJ0505007.1 hypothetical protein HanHA89_Chr12g0465581 [Helianthus annuus]KAJ0674690.1 hypothetical protein HanLR1_Chr12g0442701 [Helianthus annuus]
MDVWSWDLDDLKVFTINNLKRGCKWLDTWLWIICSSGIIGSLKGCRLLHGGLRRTGFQHQALCLKRIFLCHCGSLCVLRGSLLIM